MKYVYNKDRLRFERPRISIGKILRNVLWFFLVTLVLAIVYYLIIAFFFNTEKERRLKTENRLISQKKEQIEQDLDRLNNVISELEARDVEIYGDIFSSAPPVSGTGMTSFSFDALDSIPESKIIRQTVASVSRSVDLAGFVGPRLDLLNRRFSGSVPDSVAGIPSVFPLNGFSSQQAGASVGKKYNPFYKIMTDHEGFDMLTYAGDKVMASAPGVVSKVVRSMKGMGNYVEIDHRNGYVTVYAHLSEINVRKGKEVKRGDQIGVVGVTGMSFAPHLHYEVRKDGKPVDPVHYFFGSVTPEEYIDIVRVSAATGQSLD